MRMYVEVEVEHQVVSIVSNLLELCHCHEKNITHRMVLQKVQNKRNKCIDIFRQQSYD